VSGLVDCVAVVNFPEIGTQWKRMKQSEINAISDFTHSLCLCGNGK
jgi:hypothetical protein